MDANQINGWFQELPAILHILAFGVIIACYAHLFLGFWKIRKRIKTHVVFYFSVRFVFMLGYVISKSQDPVYGMFDFFLPIYVFSYVDGLIILKGRSFHRCNNLRAAVKKLLDFQSRKPNKDDHETKN